MIGKSVTAGKSLVLMLKILAHEYLIIQKISINYYTVSQGNGISDINIFFYNEMNVRNELIEIKRFFF